MSKRLTQEQRARIALLHNMDYSPKEIMDEMKLKCSRGVLYKIFEKDYLGFNQVQIDKIKAEIMEEFKQEQVEALRRSVDITKQADEVVREKLDKETAGGASNVANTYFNRGRLLTDQSTENVAKQEIKITIDANELNNARDRINNGGVKEYTRE